MPKPLNLKSMEEDYFEPYKIEENINNIDKFPTIGEFNSYINLVDLTQNTNKDYVAPVIINQSNGLGESISESSLNTYYKEKTKYPKNMGLDIPVILKTKNGPSNGLIVILGESALRKYNGGKGKIILGTPYAVHAGLNEPKQCYIYKSIFKKLLEGGYDLYLTDIIKLYWKGKNVKKIKTKKDIENNDTDITTFKRELTILKKEYSPIYIVSWGETASGSMRNINNTFKDDNGDQSLNIFYNRFISIPHPGKVGWINWELRIFMKKFYYNDDVGNFKKNYPNPSSEKEKKIEIIRDEVVKEILDGIKVIDSYNEKVGEDCQDITNLNKEIKKIQKTNIRNISEILGNIKNLSKAPGS